MSRPVTASVTGMLDLDPAVELEEVDVGAVDEELGRSRALVADRLREGARGGRDRRPGAWVEARSGRLLDELLVPPLHRAVAVAEHRDAATVPENLGLDVPRPLEVALAEDGSVAERSLRLAGSGSQCLVELGGGADDAHAAARRLRRQP